MRAYIVVMEGVATLLLIGLAGWLAWTAWRATRGPFRMASAGAAAAGVLLGAASLQHFLHLAFRDDLTSLGWNDVLLGPFAAARATVAVLAAAPAFLLGRQYWTLLGRSQSMVDALTDRLPTDARGCQAGLSVRELEVLDLIRRGVLSDDDIAGTLHISPATAATHVQNILRKTELHNRRDLMLLPPIQQPVRR